MSPRELDLQGAVNVRDLGGLPTADGRTVRSGRLLRSDSLSELTESDVRTLVDELQLELIIDLRAAAEVERDGRGPLAQRPVRFANLPLQGQHQVRLDLAADAGQDGDLAAHYASYLEHSGPNLVAAARLLGQTRTASVVHCAAGKDRTGILVALVLQALGVAAEEVVADYAATAANMPRVRERLFRSPSAQLRETFTVPDWILAAEPDTMRRFLTHLDGWGGAAAYLADQGFSHAELVALRDNLLT
ncbi:tyrosine-protein phosphatase [Rhodococcus sp. X156]|uniref:tyrosine-protein phosphatase n=1 Tax=Rhodococcus sp. X156 TaxID=2499145 RepID=UPI000FD87969|nr:tyrosine-protein phosphatase [Rhodococcus sp. X156]